MARLRFSFMPHAFTAPCLSRSSKHAMLSQLRKRKWLALALPLALLLVALWALPVSPPPIRVTFQRATNDPENGRVGVIELVNTRSETIDIMIGWYVPAKGNDLALSKDTPIASIYGRMPQLLSARSTNVVQVSIPTNGGPYKLVLQCMPDRTIPWRHQDSLRYRIAELVFPWVHPSQRMAVRWYGGAIVASQSINCSQ
jgi:hypothetical protein